MKLEPIMQSEVSQKEEYKYCISSVQFSRSVVSDSSRPHRLQPTRLLHPWDFLGKSTGAGCHYLPYQILKTTLFLLWQGQVKYQVTLRGK